MTKRVIEIKGLFKKYSLNHEKQLVVNKDLRDSIYNLFRKKNKKEEFWALKDISIELNQGETLGLIGRNGSGKSTLLKIISKITYPTSGYISVKGRVGALLEVGTGFHPDLTGRENIFLSGSILGMSKKEIQSHFDEIVDFSEIERFIDIPVKRFSSGMFLKLAFSVAAFLNTEILLVDEVLTVGDAAFQKKCTNKIKSIVKSGKTIIFVSHNLSSISSLCPKSILLKQGQLISYGDSSEVIKFYEKSIVLAK